MMSSHAALWLGTLFTVSNIIVYAIGLAHGRRGRWFRIAFGRRARRNVLRKTA